VGAVILTVHAGKGGVGKTTLAYELATARDDILIDLDPEMGATKMWGDRPEDRKTHMLMDCLETGALPRPKSRPGQPTLVPASSALADNGLGIEEIAATLVSWAEAWAPRNVVLDTHPGFGADITWGALKAANLVLVPAVPDMREMESLRHNLVRLTELRFRLALVPNKVAGKIPARLADWLEALSEEFNAPMIGMVSEYRFLRQRARRRAVVAEPRPGRSVAEAAAEYRAVAEAVDKYIVGRREN
jgi:cellulose biosynthesis protein BcsQ